MTVGLYNANKPRGFGPHHQKRQLALIVREKTPWRLLIAGLLVTLLASLVLYVKLNVHPPGNSNNRNDIMIDLPINRLGQGQAQHKDQRHEYPHEEQQLASDDKKNEKLKEPQKFDKVQQLEPICQAIQQTAEDAEQAILDFFHGELRALEDGVSLGATAESSRFLTRRLAQRVVACQEYRHRARSSDPSTSNGKNHNTNNNNDCIFRVVFVGSAQTSGRDIFWNQTFPFVTEERLRHVTTAAGLELQVWNHAMDHDLSREGPQTAHMCIENLVGVTSRRRSDGTAVDVIGWDFDGGMHKGPSQQVEAFVRWAVVLLQPAMIIINRGGPHGLSRRGAKRLVVNISPGHDAIVYEDNNHHLQPIPPRTEPYRESRDWKQQWANPRNSFWFKLFDSYSSVVDFAVVDPLGSIWHLDHLVDFSNQAFDAEKALPLIDCGSPGHPPPCNQVPKFVYNHLRMANMSNDSLPLHDTGGAVCGVLFGCRHSWYGGTRSHAVRGELNALPLVRALRYTAELLSSENFSKEEKLSPRALSVKSLPPPLYCSKTFCNMVPTCITSYVPNLGFNLTSTILTKETSPISMPRLGASHYVNNPSVQINDLNNRFAPLGYIDRKFAYRLALEKGHGKKKEDASTTAVAFTAKGNGPLIICEPPCFIDECSKKRKMPLVDHVTLLLDGKELLGPSKHHPWAVEIAGKFCHVVARTISRGVHSLHISTNVTNPDHVMFSHVISFS